jgi:NADP-dependent 3-hydroxy acid dehydrogenase YdfG
VLTNPVVRIDLSVGGSAWEESRLEEFHYISVLGLAMDTTDKDDVEAAVESIVAKYGTVDILMSNMGIPIISSIYKLSYGD